MKQKVGFVMGLVLIVSLGCIREGDHRDYLTKSRLYDLGSFCTRLSSDDIKGVTSFEDLLTAASDAGLPHKERYALDGWNNEFRFDVTQNRKGTLLRIISSGPNGLFEKGEGDDLFVEIRYSGDITKSVMSQSWPEVRGVTKKG
jgi:hypothetical protein